MLIFFDFVQSNMKRVYIVVFHFLSLSFASYLSRKYYKISSFLENRIKFKKYIKKSETNLKIEITERVLLLNIIYNLSRTVTRIYNYLGTILKNTDDIRKEIKTRTGKSLAALINMKSIFGSYDGR